MIKSYRDKRSQTFAEGGRVKAFLGFKRQAERRLEILDAAMNLADLAALSSNRLEAMHSDRRGQYSIAINRQWRICFEWPAGGDGPENVEIVDYH
jgi:proteic killer suppression protein